METVETLTYGPLDSLGARVALYLLLVYPLVYAALLVALRRDRSEQSLCKRWLVAPPALYIACVLALGSILYIGTCEYYNYTERQIRRHLADDLLSRIAANRLWGISKILYVAPMDESSGYIVAAVRCVRQGRYEVMLVTAKTEPELFLPPVPLESVRILRIELLDVVESEDFGEWVSDGDGNVEALPGGSAAIPSALEPREPTANRGR